jgi:pimeloyl-ACP methyl ester carboxylesterase
MLNASMLQTGQPNEFLPDSGISLRALAWSHGHVHVPPRHDAPILSSPTVVLLHGLGDGADIWRPMMAAWKIPLTVIAFDLPGHGRSPWLVPTGYHVSRLADLVAEALAQHGIVRPVLVGHSLGARIAGELAARATLNARGTILVDMSGQDSSETNRAVAAHLDALMAGAPTLEGLVRLVGDRLPLADPQAVAMAVPAMATSAEGRWRMARDPAIKHLLAPSRHPEEIWSLLARLQGPAAIVRGAYSAVMDRRMAVRIAEAVPWRPVLIETVDKAGHAVPLEQPVLLARAIEKSLRGWRVAA